MKTVTIRELHSRTGELVRQALQHGEIRVTDNGRVVAKILPEAEPTEVPYFARRRYISPGMKKLIESGQLGPGGTDSTIGISEDREDRRVSVEELHEATVRCVRQALQVPLLITDYGEAVAVLKKLEVTDRSGQPLPQREAWIARLPRTDLDSAQAVSDDRDRA